MAFSLLSLYCSGSSASLSLEKAFQAVLFLDKFVYRKAFVLEPCFEL